MTAEKLQKKVNRLIEAALVPRCLHDTRSQSLFLGRTMYAAGYVELLDRLLYSIESFRQGLPQKTCNPWIRDWLQVGSLRRSPWLA